MSVNWPNEPAGSTLITDQPFTTLPAIFPGTNGWVRIPTVTLGNDPATPLSPPGTVIFTYPIGHLSGNAPGKLYFTPPANTQNLFIGYYWKPSNPWQGDTSFINKQAFVYQQQDQGFDELWSFIMKGPPGGPYFQNVSYENGNPAILQANGLHNSALAFTATTVPLIPGNTYRLEFFIKLSTTRSSIDGIVKAWVNGTLVVNQTNVSTASSSWAELQICPTWGGNSGLTKTEVDTFTFDHYYASFSPNLPPTGGSDTTAPTAPTNVVVTPTGVDQVSVSYTAATDTSGIGSYQIETCTGIGCSNFSLVLTVTASPTVWTLPTHFVSGTVVRVRIRAVDGVGNIGPYSSIATGTSPDTTPPAAPTGLVVV